MSTPDGRLQQHKHKKQNNTTQQHAHETQKKIHLTQNSAALRFATAAASPQLRAGDRAPLRDGGPFRDVCRLLPRYATATAPRFATAAAAPLRDGDCGPLRDGGPLRDSRRPPATRR